MTPAPHNGAAAQAGIVGVGDALPEHVIPNEHFTSRLDTSDAWIVKRTGIHERHWIDEGSVELGDLAATACARALEDAGMTASDVDRILVATITADRVTPGLAPEVAGRLGMGSIPASDLNAACAGFLYALDDAAAQIATGRADTIVVCGAEALSRLTDTEDRSTAVLFGDGAGAVVVTRGSFRLGVPEITLGSSPGQTDLLYADRNERKLRMHGREVYRQAVDGMTQATRAALRRAQLDVSDVDLLIAHQANARIVEATAARLGVPEDRVALNIDRVANTSAASIPLALAQYQREGRVQPGACLGLAAFGAGFVWGAGIVGFKDSLAETGSVTATATTTTTKRKDGYVAA